MTEPAVKKPPMTVQERLELARAARQRNIKLRKEQAAQEAQAGVVPDRAATRSATRETQVHEPIREPVREKGQVLGRNGEVLSRRRKAMGDMFDIPSGLVPPGWSYQWNIHSVLGNTDIVLDQGLVMAENGWRPVPAERHPGRFMPADYKGPIIRGGMRLEERPELLTIEALEEERSKATRQMADRDESLMGRKANLVGAMQGGFEMSNRYRGTGANVKMSMERPADIPRPQHTLAGPED